MEEIHTNIDKIETTWAEAVKNNDGNFAGKLNKKVEDLFDKMTAALEEAKTANTTTRMVSAIEDFLFKGDLKKKHIDGCILWLLLWSAAGLKHETSQTSGADEAIFGMVMERYPYMAFDNPSYSKLKFKEPGSYKSIKDQCPIEAKEWIEWRQGHHFHQKLEGTPFHRAAKKGKSAIIRLIRSSLAKIEESHHGPIYALIQGEDPSKQRTTALQQVIHARHGSVATLGELLAFECLAASPDLDKIFADAVEVGTENIVDVFLTQDNLKKRFAKSDNILKAMRKAKGSLEVGQQYLRIVKKLIDLIPPEETLADEVIETIIEQQAMGERDQTQGSVASSKEQLGWIDIWKAAHARPTSISTEVKSKLLHLAVYYQSLALVTEFLQHPRYSKSVAHQVQLLKTSNQGDISAQNPHYPLWYHNNNAWIKGSAWKNQDISSKIRSMLVYSTVRQAKKMRDLSEIFYKSDQFVRELCLDLSHFNSKLHRVSSFVDSFIYHSQNDSLLSYEETLRYVEFPALDLKVDDRETFGDNNHLSVQHTEVFRLLTWLQEKMHVRHIIQLKVPDRLINPHNENCIASSPAAKGKTNADTDSMKAKEKIKELHLYSSGKRAVIDHWLSDEGIPTLTKASVSTFYPLKNSIDILSHSVANNGCPRETVTEEYCKELIPFVFNGLNAMKARHSDRPTCNFNLNYSTVDSMFWNPTHTLVDLNEIAHKVTPRLAKFLKSLGEYIPRREGQTQKILRRTRVAIIDNGVLSITPRPDDTAGGGQNKESSKHEDNEPIRTPGTKESFSVSSARESSSSTAFHESQSHDTSGRRRLSSRIKKGRSFVDEGSKLYPWHLASDPHGTQMANLICAMDPFCELYVARVAEGKYGITPDRVARVDIISMSIALLDKGNEMQHWVHKAKEKGVVIVCSTHDEGTRSLTSYPAEWKPGLIITSCDEYGRLLHNIDNSKYDFAVQGHNVSAGVIPFIESSDSITGSSVSTALIAGLGSLILTCHKVAHLEAQQPETTSIDLESSEIFPYAEGQLQMVETHLKSMVAEGTRHVVLERFGKIDSTTKQGDNVYADKVLKESFHMRDAISKD
ncbi:hypothetical protein M419DRAFT_38429 [Trichoderma reesei RUT C-30]|uniref:Peptidase S8/S53 domain-containing protein n=1 Tax=Hypocrea jecorina (strain ATCC 56765 / BCRC 32924 / NRRL 11460 / Rut C-30) TaxID=1344414 RepID=A0A024RZB8_HYPJR|nr:hypothetical protein M419DRAFT_38429 [Trichoderma reesei RUT C-30]